MNNEDLKNARMRYRNKVKENKKLDEIKREMKELENSKEVIRYLELLKYKTEEKQSDEEIVKEAFVPIGFNTKESNNIYVFMGSYTRNYGTAANSLSRIKNALWTDYNLYWDLETEESIEIMQDEVKNFENNHIVIDNKVPSLSSDYRDYLYNFQQIQATYYKSLTYTTMEKSIAKIKKMFK